MPALAVGLGALDDLHQERDLTALDVRRRSARRASRRGCRRWRSSRTESPARAARRACPSRAAPRRRRRVRADTTRATGCLRPADRRERLGVELGHHALKKVERQAPTPSSGYASSARIVSSRVASLFINTSGRRDAVAAAERQRLADDDVEERVAIACLDERLRAPQAHRRGQAAIQLDHRDAVERRRSRRRRPARSSVVDVARGLELRRSAASPTRRSRGARKRWRSSGSLPRTDPPRASSPPPL